MKITVVTVSTSLLVNMIKTEKSFSGEYPGILDLSLFYAARAVTSGKLKRIGQSIAESEAVIVDLMGSPEEIIVRVYSALETCRAQIIPIGSSARHFLRLGELTASSMPGNKQGMSPEKKKPMNMDAMKKMAGMAEKMGKIMPGKMRDMRNLSQISKYFSVADEFNLRNMLLLLLRDYGGLKELPKAEEAREIPEVCLKNPANKKYYRNLGTFRKDFPFDMSKPTVGVLFYGHTYPNDTSLCVAEIVEKIRSFANVIPIAFSSTSAKKYPYLRKMFLENGIAKVDAVINFMSFRLGAGPMGGDVTSSLDLLKEIDAVYMHPFFMSRRQETEWRESVQGINSSEFILSVMLPEFDGCAEAIPVGAMKQPEYNQKFDVDVRELKTIPERVDRFCSRLQNQLSLRRKKNCEKRIAIICYSYPPGEENVFGGSFLDTFSSLEKILEDLRDAGYSVNTMTKDELADVFLQGGVCNGAKYIDGSSGMLRYSAGVYADRLNRQSYGDEVINQWGEVPGDIMIDEGCDFLIPGILLENVFIGVQPARVRNGDEQGDYHDKALVPHHQYLAFYQWLEEEFRADAVIHVGTHGTLEFNRGKECGMSGDCFPDILISTVPHMYLYYCGNPSEAMIAKRRSHANLIGYQPAEYQQADLYGEYVSLKVLIDEYRESLRSSPVRSGELKNNIVETAEKLNLPEDLDEIEMELYRMNRSLIPRGLHIFGVPYTESEIRSYLSGLLRYDRRDMPSLLRIAAESLGHDLDEVMEQKNTELLSRIDQRYEEIFIQYYEHRSADKLTILPKKLNTEAASLFEYAGEVARQIRENRETEGLLKALDARYNQAKIAGDIFRNPEVLPTGFNLFQFDPRFVPSQTAFMRGKRIAENTLQKYREEEGKIPDTTAVILWGLETSRTQGETVGQILTYLGVRPKKKKNLWESQYELIPLDELGRKRVDSVINICGFFRDMFPNLLRDFNKIFQMLAQADEPEEKNTYKKNCGRIYRELIDRGHTPEEARELSRARIFGPEEGQYGTGLTGIVEARKWQKEEELGQEFVRSLRHVYTENYRGQNIEGLLDTNLKAVEVVSQVRSNHEYEVTDLDHYYEFIGGLAKSVENAKGKKAKVYISDTTGETVQTDSINSSVARGIRTRVLNPKWIDGMLRHKYHGAQKIADRFENVLGLAATTGGVDEWIYDDLFAAYVEDEKMRRRMTENNPFAYADIIERMMEYYNRNYWKATEEQIEKLKQTFLEIEGDIEANS
jgi:cobaltochelatase CobN